MNGIRTALCLGLACAAAAQSPCLDQSYVPTALTNGLEVTANQPVTQTFTVGRTGRLLQVEVSRIRHHNGLSTQPLTVAIVATTAAGVPTTTTLAAVAVPPASVPTAIGALLVDLASFNLQVTAGQVLGLALSSPNGPGAPSYAWWGVAPNGGYAAGQVFIQQTTGLSVWDLAFQTWVSMPPSVTNYGVGHPGTAGVPVLASSAAPVLGTTPNVLIGNSANAATIGVLFLGVTTANVPTPFGGVALVQPLASVGVALPVGGAPVPFPIPAVGALCGLVVDMQAIVVDAGASAGLAFTRGLEWTIGV